MMSSHSAGLPDPPPDPCRVAAVVAARHCRVGLRELLHPTRCSRDSADARALAMYLAHVGLGLGIARVAAGFARHRSTVVHACRRIEEQRENARRDRQVATLEEEARACVHRRGGSRATMSALTGENRHGA